jgi:hypothetical protein
MAQIHIDRRTRLSDSIFGIFPSRYPSLFFFNFPAYF